MAEVVRGRDPFSLAGKTAIVSGGARGIGAAVAQMLAAQGAHVVVADMLVAEGREVASALGVVGAYQPLDVTDEQQWADAVSAAIEWRGGLDILVNCAGIASFEAILDFDLERFTRVMQVNLTGTFLGMKHSAPAMTAGGSIINISSTSGLEGGNSMAAYCSSKWAVRGLTKVGAMELGARHIRVNSVHPGPINTPMLNPGNLSSAALSGISMLKRMPISRIGETSEIASVCCFLASEAASFMTGAELAVDGGATVGMFHQGRPGAPPTL